MNRLSTFSPNTMLTIANQQGGQAFPASAEAKREALMNAILYGGAAALSGAASIPAVMGGGAGAAMLIPTALASGAVAANAADQTMNYMNADQAYSNEYGPGNRQPDFVTDNGPIWLQQPVNKLLGAR